MKILFKKYWLLFSIIIFVVIVGSTVPKVDFKFTKGLIETLLFDSIHVEKIYVTDVFTEPDHSKLTFTDSAVIIAGGSHVQITNASDSIYKVLDQKGVIYLKGDTILITKSGGYNIYCSIHGYSTTGIDWEAHTALNRAGVTTYGDQVISFTTTGGTNRDGDSFTFYNEYEVGDKVFLVLSKLSVAVADYTIVSSNFNIQQLYMK